MPRRYSRGGRKRRGGRYSRDGRKRRGGSRRRRRRSRSSMIENMFGLRYGRRGSMRYGRRRRPGRGMSYGRRFRFGAFTGGMPHSLMQMGGPYP